MDKIKNFLKSKKVDKNFKKAGTGHRLTDPRTNDARSHSSSSQSPKLKPVPSSVERSQAADVAAAAALKRLTIVGGPPESAGQKKIRLLAKRELDLERQRGVTEPVQDAEYSPNEPDIKEFDHSDVLDGVYFTCDYLGSDIVLPKDEMRNALAEFLLNEMENDDPVVPSILLFFSLNTSDVIKNGREVLAKYVQNIIDHPNEEKFQKIRIQNKNFQDKVANSVGGIEFLKAIGFEEKKSTLKDGDPEEDFLIYNRSKFSGINLEEHLVQILEMLEKGEAIPLNVYRNPKVYMIKENQKILTPKLPAEFYSRSGAELKKEQAQKALEVDKLTTLRTQEMRKRDELLRQYTYKFTLIRIRFPNCYVLEGTFRSLDTVSELFAYVASFLWDDFPFQLKDPVTGKILNDFMDKNFGELGLAPASVIHFNWHPDIFEEWQRMNRSINYMKEEHNNAALPLN